jgi:hypothetical protein
VGDHFLPSLGKGVGRSSGQRPRGGGVWGAGIGNEVTLGTSAATLATTKSARAWERSSLSKNFAGAALPHAPTEIKHW